MDPINEAYQDSINEASTYNDKADKIDKVSYGAAMKLIYEWIKKREISLKEFKSLMDVNRSSVN